MSDEREVNMLAYGVRNGVGYLTIYVRTGQEQETFRLTDEAKRRLLTDVVGGVCDENAIAKRRCELDRPMQSHHIA